MVSATTQADITSADKTGIGFDYQYYFFLWKLLSLEIGQTVGLECKDDVHTDLADDVQILYQVKHTIKTSEKTKKPSNLTTFDIDLWKTLSNWSKVITDTNASRSTQNEQIKFIDKTYFVLASNKSESSNNEFAKIIKSLQEGEITIEEARENLKSLKKKLNLMQ
ncbi:hypothetical protein [Thaumasiovibrio subtropicus]|uniref:hypothetical protein n=2 Tax=Thaumasiovibrio subtropicus TaxID=1891207 RepID=UPI001C85F0BB|nr:hypothetical protein [Thaumasiovibrio subtropicus]